MMTCRSSRKRPQLPQYRSTGTKVRGCINPSSTKRSMLRLISSTASARRPPTLDHRPARIPRQSAVRAQTSPDLTSPRQGKRLRRTRAATVASAASPHARPVSPGSDSMPKSSSAGPRDTEEPSTAGAGLVLETLVAGSLAASEASVVRRSALTGRAKTTWPQRPRNRRQLGAMQVATLPAVNDTSEYTERYKTTQNRIGPYCCRHTKLAGAAPRCMRCQNLARGTPLRVEHALNAAVCLQTQLREEAERNNAFCVPEKQEQRMPLRWEDQMTAESALPLPTRSRIARDRDCGSPTMTALTVLARLPMGVDDGSPQARRTQALKASIMRESKGRAGARRDEAQRGTAPAADRASSAPPQPSSPSASCTGPSACGRGRLSHRVRLRAVPAPT